MMDGSSPFIPKSQIADDTKVGLEFRIDGTVKQSGTTADMIFEIPSLISFVSGIMRLEVGFLFQGLALLALMMI